MDTFLRQLFSLQAFEADFKLVNDENVRLSIPNGIKKEHFVNWIEGLKTVQTPSWLGLPNSAENVLLTKICNEIINKLLAISILHDEEDEYVYTDNEKTNTATITAASTPFWLKNLNVSVKSWLALEHGARRQQIGHIAQW